MAEHDVSKHTREIVKLVKEPGKLKHKIVDIFLEIGIIVFAITLSLFVERYREHQQEVKLEHNFLANQVDDVKANIQQLKEDSAGYVIMLRSFDYLKQAYFGKKLQPDSALFAVNYLYNSVEFVPSSSRYEALKASGKLDVIENKQLQIDIVNFYQLTIPALVTSTTDFSDFKNKLGDYTDHNLVLKKNSSNIQQLMESPVFYNLLNKGEFIKYIILRYHITIAQAQKILKEISGEESTW
jgi:hypothetical protein